MVIHCHELYLIFFECLHQRFITVDKNGALLGVIYNKVNELLFIHWLKDSINTKLILALPVIRPELKQFEFEVREYLILYRILLILLRSCGQAYDFILLELR